MTMVIYTIFKHPSYFDCPIWLFFLVVDVVFSTKILFLVFFPVLYKKMKYTFISVPALGDKQNTFLNIKGKLTEYAQTYKFTIPEFKVSETYTR
jgi:hypothetical protein